jgi:hypothetical protein
MHGVAAIIKECGINASSGFSNEKYSSIRYF